MTKQTIAALTKLVIALDAKLAHLDRNIQQRVSKLEFDSHALYDFTALLARIDALSMRVAKLELPQQAASPFKRTGWLNIYPGGNIAGMLYPSVAAADASASLPQRVACVKIEWEE